MPDGPAGINEAGFPLARPTPTPTEEKRLPPEPPEAGTPPPGAELDALHRRIHRTFLVAIAVSAAAAALSGFADAEPPPARATTMLAIGLGLGCIVLRRLALSPMIGPRAELRLGVAGLVCGAALALLGATIAWTQDAGRTGLAYSGAAFILCARPPIPSHLRVRRHKVDAAE